MFVLYNDRTKGNFQVKRTTILKSFMKRQIAKSIMGLKHRYHFSEVVNALELKCMVYLKHVIEVDDGLYQPKE